MPQLEPFKLGIVAKMNNDGLLLTTIEKGSHSDNAGLKVGDVILGADRRYAKSLSASERKQFIEGLHVWRAELIILRGGRDVLAVEILDDLKRFLGERLVAQKLPRSFELVDTPLRDDAGRVRRSQPRDERMMPVPRRRGRRE